MCGFDPLRRHHQNTLLNLHRSRFSRAPSFGNAPRFYTLRAINAKLDERELCRQLEEMHRHGYDGAVFHSGFYPNDPPYLGDACLASLSQVILHAKSIGIALATLCDFEIARNLSLH